MRSVVIPLAPTLHSPQQCHNTSLIISYPNMFLSCIYITIKKVINPVHTYRYIDIFTKCDDNIGLLRRTLSNKRNELNDVNSNILTNKK